MNPAHTPRPFACLWNADCAIAAAKDGSTTPKYVGAAYTQAGVAVGLYVIGRYAVPKDPENPVVEGTSPRTNK